MLKSAQNSENVPKITNKYDFGGVRERRLENSKLAKYIFKCHEIDAYVKISYRKVCLKSRKRVSENADGRTMYNNIHTTHN